MNKTLIGAVVTVIILGGGAFALTRDNAAETNNNQKAAESSNADAMEKKDGEDTMEKADDVMEKKDDAAMEKTDDAMMKKAERYVTFAEFESHKDSYKDQTKVLFFHASWCPICKSIDEDITSDPSQIPSSATFIKTDFDSSTELRQKYGVTTQYTFVQIDNDGNEVDQWSATTLDKAIAGIN